MWGKKIITASLALAMIFSGLVITTVGMDSDLPVVNSDEPIVTSAITPTGGKRTVLMEDFTNWACGPCVSWNVIFTQVGLSYPRDRVVPMYHHWYFPSTADPVWVYSDPEPHNHYQAMAEPGNGVPNAYLDGIDISEYRPTTPEGVAVLESRIEARMGVPANLTIFTSGTKNAAGGSVTANITLTEPVVGKDFRVLFSLKEEYINCMARFGQNSPNGEIDMQWSVWDIYPAYNGQPISLINPGDSVEVTYPFTFEPTWDWQNISVACWVLDWNTRICEQAANEDFTPSPQETNDMDVWGTIVEPNMEAGKPYTVECVVYNTGSSDETNIQVDLTLDGGVEMTEIIPFIASNKGAYVSFDWNAPAIAGGYQVGFDVTPVPGETDIADNTWQTPITVTYQPDIWYTPLNFDFTVAPDEVDFDSLTVGNDGTANLDYTIDFGTKQEEFGASTGVWGGGARDRGNIYAATTDTILWETQMYLNIAIATEVYFFIYESTAFDGTYNKIEQTYFPSLGGGGQAWYSSGPMSSPITAGKYYYIGAAWNLSCGYYNGGTVTPFATLWGTLETGQGGGAAGIPPAATCAHGNTPGQRAAYYQRVTTGLGQANWLSVNPDTGTVVPSAQTDCMLTVDATGLSAGLYRTSLYLSSNDLDEGGRVLTVSMYVVTETDDVAVYSMKEEGLLEIGEPVWVNGTILNIGSDDQTNVEIQFQVDFALEDTTTIPSLLGSSTVDISFLWIVPIGLTFDLTLYILPVTGETLTGDNTMTDNVNIPPEAIAWTNPASFNFVMNTNEVDFDNLTIGNDGTTNLDYNIYLGNVEEEFGATTNAWGPGGARDRGNIYEASISTTIREIQQYFNFAVASDMYMIVYEGPQLLGDFVQVASILVNSGTGAGWRTSGPISVPMTAGMFYYIGAAWNLAANYYSGTLPTPIPCSFGSLVTGQGGGGSGYPPAAIASPGWDVGAYPAYYQRVETGVDAPTWLNVNPLSGSVAGLGGQTDCMLTVDSAGLGDGSYYTEIILASNDPDDPGMIIPVDLTVGGSTTYDIPIVPGPTGWEFISFPIAVSGDVTTVLDDALFGDGATTWDMVQWYDAEEQIWKTYATFKPASLNTMPVMNNAMGVWVHITASGDGVITTGIEGLYPSVPVNVFLYTGWNLVGYPSATSRLASDTLPAQANMVSVYDIGQPYAIRDETVLTGVTMQEGDAFWVHVSGDCTWQVDP